MVTRTNCYINEKRISGNLYQIEKLDDKGRTVVVYDGYYNDRTCAYTLYPRKTFYPRKGEDIVQKHVISDRLVYTR